MNWRERLYEAYVSSGQATRKQYTTPEQLFASRKPYIDKIIGRHIPDRRDTKIVDLGCGHGAFLYFLALAGYINVEGVDVSAEQVALAKKLGVSEARQSDIMSYLSVQSSDSIGVILLMDILEHLSRQELFDVLDSVHRVLCPGGRLIIHVPNGEGIFGMRVRYGDLTHELTFTSRSISQALSTIGFVNIRCFEDNPIPHSFSSIARWAVWKIGTVLPRVLLLAETGHAHALLTQNMLVVSDKCN